MLGSVVKLPFRVVRRVVRAFRGGTDRPADEVRLPVRTNPDGPAHKPAPAGAAPAPAREHDHDHGHDHGHAHDHGHDHDHDHGPTAGGRAEHGVVAPQVPDLPGTAGGPAHDNAEAPQPAGKGKGGKKTKKAAAAKDDKPSRDVKVHAEATPNPNARKFATNVTVVEKGSFSFTTAEAAKGHPLAEALFAVPGVKVVFGVNDFVTVTKEDRASWDELEGRLERVISDVLSRG